MTPKFELHRDFCTVHRHSSSFIILCLLVRKLSCWQSNKQTNRQTDALRTSNTLHYATTLRNINYVVSVSTRYVARLLRSISVVLAALSVTTILVLASPSRKSSRVKPTFSAAAATTVKCTEARFEKHINTQDPFNSETVTVQHTVTIFDRQLLLLDANLSTYFTRWFSQ